MLKDTRAAICRNHATLVQDALGVVALMVILMVGLHLPVLA